MRFKFGILVIIQILAVFTLSILPQDTNPVEREVANPLRDTPKLNPVSPERKLTAANKRKQSSVKPVGGSDELIVDSVRSSVSGEKGKHIIIHEGNVDVHYGIYRLQADKITIYEAENKMVAEGSVVFDQGEDQRITGSTATWNYKTKLGNFINSTGYTNQTNDGDVVYFKGDKVERTKLNETVITNGEFTACEDAVPKMEFYS